LGEKGIWIQDTRYVLVDSNFVDGFDTGIDMGNDSGTTSTPTLTNNSVLTSPQSSREQGNVGIRVVGNVAGTVYLNEVTACDSAIIVSTANPKIYENTLYLQNMGTSVGIYAENSTTLDIHDNTIYNYYTGFNSQNTTANFNNNIVWHVTNAIDETGSTLTVNYNDILGGYTGIDNIDANPQFTSVDSADVDFLHLNWASPCIDAGNPSYSDSDGTTSDIGVNNFEQSTSLSAPAVEIIVSIDEFNRVVRTISWEEIEGAISYNVYNSNTPAGPWTKINDDPIRTTSYESIGGSVMKFFRVTANNGVSLILESP